MKTLSLLLLLSSLAFSQKNTAPTLTSESYTLINDLNAAEGKPAIYMCRDVNGIWPDYLHAPTSDNENEKKLYDRKMDTIAKYLGGNVNNWKKNFAFIESWQPHVKAAEYVTYRGLDIEDFYKKHNRNGVYLYSPPLFDNSRTKALIYVWYFTGNKVSFDSYYYCEKENGKWGKNSTVLIGGFGY